MIRLPGENVRLLVEGKSRAILRAVTQEEPFFVGALDEVEEPGTPVPLRRTRFCARHTIILKNTAR